MVVRECHTTILPVLGMSCASCQHHVEAALLSTEGVESVRVDLMTHRATVEVVGSNPAVPTMKSIIYRECQEAVGSIW